jgi:hypothetical protein
MESPANVNVFHSYYEARVYASRPADQFNVVATCSTFSQDVLQWQEGQMLVDALDDRASFSRLDIRASLRGCMKTRLRLIRGAASVGFD